VLADPANGLSGCGCWIAVGPVKSPNSSSLSIILWTGLFGGAARGPFLMLRAGGERGFGGREGALKTAVCTGDSFS